MAGLRLSFWTGDKVTGVLVCEQVRFSSLTDAVRLLGCFSQQVHVQPYCGPPLTADATRDDLLTTAAENDYDVISWYMTIFTLLLALSFQVYVLKSDKINGWCMCVTVHHLILSLTSDWSLGV
jgi:hypothetical protein